MNLIPKCPVENPCEAACFEEAFSKNNRRLAFELGICVDLWNDTPPEERTESCNPEFWKGAIVANAEAKKIFEEEWNRFAETVARRVNALESKTEEKTWKQGFDSIRDSVAKALEDNEPRTIVYW